MDQLFLALYRSGSSILGTEMWSQNLNMIIAAPRVGLSGSYFGRQGVRYLISLWFGKLDELTMTFSKQQSM